MSLLAQRNRRVKVPRGNQCLVIGPIRLFLAFIILWFHANCNFVTAKTPAKEVAPASPTRRTKSAQTITFSGTPKPPEFFDITKTSEEKQSVREVEGDEAAREGLATEESSNTSAKSNPVSMEHPQASQGKDENSGEEPSSKDDSKKKIQRYVSLFFIDACFCMNLLPLAFLLSL